MLELRQRRHPALLVPALALIVAAALVAPAAAPGEAQRWDPPSGPPWTGFDYLFPLYTYAGENLRGGPLLFGFSLWPMLPVPAPMPSGTNLQLQQLEATNRGDVGAFTALMTDDATYYYSDGVGLCTVAACTGKAAIQP
jgi:hypothetical protein